MAKLKAVYKVDDEDFVALSDEMKGLYEERDSADGKTKEMRLVRIEGMSTQADVDRLQAAHTKERKDHTETKAKLKAYGDITPELAIEQRDKVTELEARVGEGDDKTIDERVEKIVESRIKAIKGPIERERDKLKGELDAAAGKVTELSGTITRSRISDAVRGAVAKEKVIGEAVDDVLLNAERLFEINADTGAVVMKDGVGFQPGIDPGAWLSDMKEKRPHWWPAAQGGGAGGGGKMPAGTNNPFSAAQWNKTEQSKLTESNPTRAEQLAKMAGFGTLQQANLAGKAIQKAA